MIRRLLCLSLILLALSACEKIFKPVDSYDTDEYYTADVDVMGAVEQERTEEWKQARKSKHVRDYFEY